MRRIMAYVLLPAMLGVWISGFRKCASAAGLSQIPPLLGSAWLNSRPLTPRSLKGKVVLVDFWEYTCVNCIRTLPYIERWYARYHKYGLVIVGVHTPEFEFGKKEKNVALAVKELGIKYPVVLDNNYNIWNEFHNEYWPRELMFDAGGKLRHDHAGEGDYGTTEAEIQELLHQIHPDAKFPRPLVGLTPEDTPGAVCYPMTPELYVGYWRGTLGNPEGYKPGRAFDYRDPGHHKDGVIYAQGVWLNEPQAMRHAKATSELSDYIAIRYHAISVNAVIRPEGEERFKVYVFQDGRPLPNADKGADIRYDGKGRSYLLVSEAKMYQVVHNASYGSHELRLTSESPGFALYSYTFGSCSIPAQ